jgi:predicted aspartyl protease
MAKQKKQSVHALTHFNQGIARSIETPVEIANIFTNQKVATKGIWDTGATNSVVTKSTAAFLGLLPVKRTRVRGVHGFRLYKRLILFRV